MQARRGGAAREAQARTAAPGEHRDGAGGTQIALNLACWLRQPPAPTTLNPACSLRKREFDSSQELLVPAYGGALLPWVY